MPADDWKRDCYALGALGKGLARLMLERVINYRAAHDCQPEALPVTEGENADLAACVGRLDYVTEEDGIVYVDGIPMVPID